VAHDSDSPRIGCVKYLNARPLAYGWRGEIAYDHPAALCARLAAGHLDVALVSSFEFLRNPIYTIVDGVSISSDGPVWSVFVAHAGDWSAVHEIEIDSASQTSVHLLRCLLAGSEQTIRSPGKESNEMSPLPHEQGRLLIGDQAIHFRQKFGDEYCYWDLGAEWQRLTGLPFVYALWFIRPEVADAPNLASKLRARRDANLARLDGVIAAQREFDPAFCEFYYKRCLRFSFGAREKEGLKLFESLCEKNKILPEAARDFRFV